MTASMSIPPQLWRGAALVALLLSSCSAPDPVEPVAVRPVPLPLEFDGGPVDTEFSGICWWGDDLFLLPQYAGESDKSVFAIHRDSIARAIGQLEAGMEVAPIRPRRIPTDTGEVPERIKAYDGLEAFAIRDGRCYALAEFGEGTDRWGSRLLAGSIERDGDEIRFERIADTALDGPQMRDNFTHEALVLADDEVWVLCELNGRSVTERPVLARFDRELNPLSPLEMPALEYRITDATGLDDEGRFWVLNLFWPPDAKTVDPADPSGPVERIVGLRRVGDRIVVDPERPVLDLRAGGDHAMYNWEGVARWGEDGFLLVTDSYPADLLAFVAIPD